MSKIKVMVGMSGGVDSTISAYLLKNEGYDVIGLTMKIWAGEERGQTAGRGGCYGPNEAADIISAKHACEQLNIPHHTIDLTHEYANLVLNNYRNEYHAGRTPNPCVLCNQTMKFGQLLKKAQESGLDFDYFATGHYAQVIRNPQTKRYQLRKAVDIRKDQSYFLYRLNQQQLSRALFPLGKATKTDVVELAQKAGFGDIASKPESQDFLDDVNLRNEILAEEGRSGEILDMDGKVVGSHQGISGYTVGQRKGLNIQAQKRPMYVIRINAQENQLVVGPKEFLMTQKVWVSMTNWVKYPALEEAQWVRARLRSRQTERPCLISQHNSRLYLASFAEPAAAAAPGQSIVFYDDEDFVVGGGVIQSVETPQHGYSQRSSEN